MRHELEAVWNALRRADPSSPHVYGSMTGLLAQGHASTPASATNVLPPLQQQQQAPMSQQQGQWAGGPNAMQGVEFGGMRPYEHPHR